MLENCFRLNKRSNFLISRHVIVFTESGSNVEIQGSFVSSESDDLNYQNKKMSLRKFYSSLENEATG